jgi:hypothetical protein
MKLGPKPKELPFGDDALKAFELAKGLIAEGKMDEARKVKLLPSDRTVLRLEPWRSDD